MAGTGGTEIGFYQLKRSPLERALPRLLELALAQHKRVVVRCASKARLDYLNDILWTYDQGSFLPHGGADDGRAGDQPVYLTTGIDTPNGASVLVLTDGLEADDLDAFERCLDLFDGNDAHALDAARARWRGLKDKGHRLTYWAQGEDGRWRKQEG
jgi:DNA polymerase-3 subunit chi